ncbi:carbohydrate ABC transporter permease [Varunaivibrio sulfuroxidans]|uniref:Trehalose/maltose transport system permease protein n=1 Tax=Varunaivibrio sulfuroxidans TaxID=1773489 RepID=A0A4R3JC48_9PROT|nr:sugar ABC transporter permease [Varunaivibrio sulfuroxidans]TCS62220.1 trehalose/maltose transport system permease protein [Varunaivibrio sulfuroxidans]WES30645.1 sugar ABC transporter permease [Varunaivibrio sulfuroxidans]
MAKRSNLTRARLRAAWIFLAPMLIVLVLVAGWPLGRTIWFGFTDASLSNMSVYHFIGLDNYLVKSGGAYYGVLVDPVWWHAVWNTVRFSLISVSFETVLGLIVALVLNARFFGRAVVRAAILIPWAIPTIVSAKMWGWMLHDQFGIINDMLSHLGLISHPIAWTANPDTAMWAVIMVDVWKTTPFMALLILAGLQMLPSDCYEAARVDGVHPVKVFFRVTLPLVWPAVMVAVIFRMLDALRIFDLIYVLTSNSEGTMSMSVYARQQLVDFQDVGIGSAASTLLFLIIAALTIVFIFAGRVKVSD